MVKNIKTIQLSRNDTHQPNCNRAPALLADNRDRPKDFYFEASIPLLVIDKLLGTQNHKTCLYCDRVFGIRKHKRMLTVYLG